jgi:hypothetical protein
VYLVSGNVTIDSAGKQKTVKQKQLLFKKDILSLKKGAEITLVNKDEKFFKIKIAGSKEVSRYIEDTRPATGDGATAKYVKFIFSELFDPSHDFEKFKKKNIAGIRGGVSRGDDCNNRVLPVDGFKTSGISIAFKWRKTSPSSNYGLEVYDGENKPLDTIYVKDTVVTLKINETMNGKPGIYKWRVISGYDTCEDERPIYFEVLTLESEQKLIEQLIAAIGNDSWEKQFQQVDKLEKNGLIDAASSRYAALVKANADDKTLLKSYIAFLLKYGFEEEARAAWKP